MEFSKIAIRCCTIGLVLILLLPISIGHAGELDFRVCRQISAEQMAAIFKSKLFPSEQKNGCRWSETPGGEAFFQIGLIESQKNLRDYFEKRIPENYRLIKINDLGDRGLMTTSRGYLSVVAVREGGWVMISTVDLLYVRQGDERQKRLWDIYRGILHRLD